MSNSTQIWVGLDVHKDSVSLAALRGSEQEPFLEQRLGYGEEDLRRGLKRLAGQGEVHVCYEAGGFGYVLHRKLVSWGYDCGVAAPSLIPRKPGDRVKTDPRDARMLATYFRGGSLTCVHVPSPEEECWRSVVRTRHALHRDAHRTQQRVLKLLQARGHFYREGGKHWTQAFDRWLAALPLGKSDRALVDIYLAERSLQLQLMERVVEDMKPLSVHERWGKPLARLQCLRGVEFLTSAGLVTEIVDIERFAGPRELMGWAGLGVEEHSSGERVRRGHVSKAGNAEVRRLMVEAAWNNAHPPRLGEPLRRRLKGQDPAVIAHAWRAQERLYETWRKLGPRSPKLAATAMARELLGFVFALWRAGPEDLKART
jgi:transposase